MAFARALWLIALFEVARGAGGAARRPLARARARAAAPRLAARMRPEPSWLDRLFSGEPAPAAAAPLELRAARDYLTARPGFALRVTLGSAPARAAGGSGTLAKGSSATVSLELRVRFEADATDALDPLQGDVSLLRPSRFFETPPAFWLAEYERPGDAVPALWQMRLGCAGVEASGGALVPRGTVFFNGNLRARTNRPIGGGDAGGWELAGGTVTVKEAVPGSRGILAELKIVGTFEVVALSAEDPAADGGGDGGDLRRGRSAPADGPKDSRDVSGALRGGAG